jgi:hypothetical protein
LPTLTIAGETLSPTTPGDWIAISPCCFKTREVMLSGEAWNEVKSSLIAFDEREASVYHDVYARDNKRVTVPGSYTTDIEPFVLDGTITPCDDSPYLCNTLHEVNHEREERFLIARWRRKSIETYIFRALAQTDADDGPVCRWFVVSRINIEYRAAEVTTLFEHRQTTAGADTCCEAYGLYEANRTAATDAELFAALADGSLEDSHYSSHSFSLYSAKTYLTLPTGSIVFAPGTPAPATFSTSPCIDVGSTVTHGTVSSYDTGRYPVAWTDPSVVGNTAFSALCNVKVTFASSYGCVEKHFNVGNLDVDRVSSGGQLSGSGPFLQSQAIFFVSTTPSTGISQVCTEECVSGFPWPTKILQKSKVRDLTFSHSFQNYIARTIDISPGSWTILF